MDLSFLTGNLPAILVVVAALFLFSMLTRGRPDATRYDVAESLLAEVKLNLAMAEAFHLLGKPRRFEIGSWRRNRERTKFLGKQLQAALEDAYRQVATLNLQIDAARKRGDDAAKVDISPIKEPFARSRQGLEEWFYQSTGSRNPHPRYPNVLDGFFRR